MRYIRANKGKVALGAAALGALGTAALVRHRTGWSKDKGAKVLEGEEVPRGRWEREGGNLTRAFPIYGFKDVPEGTKEIRPLYRGGK